MRLPRINHSHCHWVLILSQQAFCFHETVVSNHNVDFPRFRKTSCLFLRASSGNLSLVRFLWTYETLRCGVRLYLFEMINPLYSLQSFPNFIQLPNAGRTFVKPLFNNDARSKNLFLTKQSTFCAHLIRWLFVSFIRNSFLFFFYPLFSLRFSRELLLIKIIHCLYCRDRWCGERRFQQNPRGNSTYWQTTQGF